MVSCCNCNNINDNNIEDNENENSIKLIRRNKIKAYPWNPQKIGNFILLYGDLSKPFPYHIIVGPDWGISIYGIFLLLSISGVIYGTTSDLGWPTVLIGCTLTFITLIFYLCVIFSDPGIIFHNDYTDDEDIEEGNNNNEENNINNSTEINEENTTTTINTNGSQQPAYIKNIRVPKPTTIECGTCNVRRPRNGRHCGHCGTCLLEIDHHCPW